MALKSHIASESSVQIEDTLVEFFPNRREVLNITHYSRNNVRLFNTYALHNHLYAEIFVCCKGTVNIKTPHGLFELSSGDIAIIPAGVMHAKLKDHQTQEVVWASAGLICSECRTVGKAHIFSHVSAVINSNNVSVFKTNPMTYEIMVNILQKKSDSITLSDKIRFASEFCCLAADTDIHPCKSSGTSPDFDRLIKFDTLINTTYTTNISNKWFADELFMSERQLSRFVNRFYGVPLHTLINNKRVEAAAELLLETDNSVEQIADLVGFNGKTGFYREFKRFYGKTPLQYKKGNK